MAEIDPKKKALADALSAMAAGQPMPPAAPPPVPLTRSGPVSQSGQQLSGDEMLAMAAYKARFTPTRHALHDPMSKRRTIIPILLTGGVLLIALAVYILTSRGEEGIYDVFPHWISPMLILGGVLSLGLAVYNMYVVRCSGPR